MAPLSLRDDFTTVLLAFEQMQDHDDGVVTGDQVTREGTPQFLSALIAIDSYTSGACHAHLGTALPTSPEP